MAFDVYTGLRTFLLADGGIAALVGTDIYPVTLPQAVPDLCVKLKAYSGVPAKVLKGAPSSRGPRVQIDCYSRERSGVDAFGEARALGLAIRTRLEGYSGEWTDASTSPEVTVHVGIPTLEVEPVDDYENDAVGGFYIHRASYHIQHGVNGA